MRLAGKRLRCSGHCTAPAPHRSLLFAHRLHWFLNSYAVRTAPAFTSPLVSSVAQQVRPAAPGTGDPLADFYGNPCPLTRAITATGRTAARRFMDSGPGRLVLAGTAGAGKSSMQLVASPTPEAATAAGAQDTLASQALLSDSKGTTPVPPPASDAYHALEGNGSEEEQPVTLVAAALPARIAPRSATARPAAWYGANLMFWDEFLQLSRRLRETEADQRNPTLRSRLAGISAAYLGAHVGDRVQATLYVPVGDPHNRIVAVHPEHSFCFKTKERVPFMAVLEVVGLSPVLFGHTKAAARRARVGASNLDAYLAGQQTHALHTTAAYASAARARRQRRGRKAAPAPAHPPPSAPEAHGASRFAAYTWGLGDSESSSEEDGEGKRDRGESGNFADMFADASERMREFGRAAGAAATAAFQGLHMRAQSATGAAAEGAKRRRKRSARQGSVAEALPDGGASPSSSDGGGTSASERGHVELISPPRLAGGGEGARGGAWGDAKGTEASPTRPILPPRGIRPKRRGGAARKQAPLAAQQSLLPPTQHAKAHGTGQGRTLKAPSRARAALDHSTRYGVGSSVDRASAPPDLEEGDGDSVFSDSDGQNTPPAAQAVHAVDAHLHSPGAQRPGAHPLGMWQHGRGDGVGAGASHAAPTSSSAGETRALKADAPSRRPAALRSPPPGMTDFEANGGVSDIDEAIAAGVGARRGGGGAAAADSHRPRGASEVGSVVEEGGGEEGQVVNVAFTQRWKDKAEEVRASSPYGHHEGWRLVPVIIKSHDDLRQEQFTSQLLQQMAGIWKAAGVPVWLRPYDILATDEDGGIIEAIPDTVSLHALKNGDDSFTDLSDWFTRHFRRGRHGSKRDSLARQNFARSLAGYSLACYLLQIKDRHNGNILLDANGHIIHIDFGFLFTSSPGGNMNFEAAPFKLTADFVSVLGGKDSRLFSYYRSLCIRGFMALRKAAPKLLLLVEMTLAGNSHLPCFQKGPAAVMSELNSRFAPHLNTDSQVADFMNGLINSSAEAFSTSMYDTFQYLSLGIRA